MAWRNCKSALFLTRRQKAAAVLPGNSNSNALHKPNTASLARSPTRCWLGLWEGQEDMDMGRRKKMMLQTGYY